MIGLVFLILGILAIVFLVVFVPSTTTDWDSPLNFFMFQSPGLNRYTENMVNLWIPKPWRNVSGVTTDHARIPCLIEQHKDGIDLKNRKLILYSHGNAEDLLSCSQFVRELSSRLEMDVVTWDYSGYGLNPYNKFERSVEGMNLSLKTILENLIAKGYLIQNIILWGYSLGTGPSTALASYLSRNNQKLAGLILFGAYSSILDVARQHVSAKIIDSLFQERWDNKKEITEVKCPVLLMHGQSDGLIPAKHAEVLHKAALTNSKLVLFPNVGHTQFSWSDAMKEVSRWMKEKNIV